ncbi:MAG: hypothetical protein MH137_05225 [Flavobacteriales bacterium]|nr:hypothetical protein [Flavobacteriales bacterium]
MTKGQTHIIHKVNLHIEAPNKRTAMHWHNNAGELMERYVFPQLEILLKKYESDGHIIRLEKLELQLDINEKEQAEKSMAQHIINQLENTIVQSKNKVNENEQTETLTAPKQEHRIIEAFVYFIKTGVLPWYIHDTTELHETKKLIAHIQRDHAFFLRIFDKEFRQKEAAIERIMAQYGAEMSEYIFGIIYAKKNNTALEHFEKEIVEKLTQKNYPRHSIRTFISLLKWGTAEYPDTQKNTLWSEWLQLFSSEKKHVNIPLRFAELDEILAKENTQHIVAEKELETKEKKKQESQTEKTKDVYIHHAGLVLLHPFLLYFFTRFNWIADEKFVDNDAQESAAHLLHYAATYQENQPDFELVFAKYLCGLPASHITNRNIVLTEEMKAEATKLLGAAVKYWDALKGASPEALQETFLQRKGKLELNDSADKITIEKSATDILLDKLPWNISLIRLPWLKKLIYVDWKIQ